MTSGNDEKRRRFVHLAERRVNSVIKRLRLLGNLSNRNNYEYAGTQVKQLLDAIDREVRDLKFKFEVKGKTGTTGFKFKAEGP